ncbi:MAG TPA: helix-hairpin-helix domain-containing protein [Devosia sp.]|jgi:predicted flap endonuclease-1-like 5' DNA nuclease|uniref:helix-hairpin-helix domain-containing protein n=1 Tax=Devosia sp. TaxID=1871048 RepID=UPI002DDD9CF6|nr:helix-hairpin-helix domain-containing protein [Devosia sp.]HEV2515768.1 helix-hairpin-helix domain-containing protein [Devosia sp.]
MSALPGIGRPAAQALELIGITTLEQVAAHSEKDLLALHGVGPKAILILRLELEARGMQFVGASK